MPTVLAALRRRRGGIGRVAIQRVPDGENPPRAVPPPKERYDSVSIVIAVCGQWQYTRECLLTLHDDLPNAEVIVVNNASKDETLLGLLETEVKDCVSAVIHNNENLGVSKAWNQGLRFARGDVLCVLNNDVIVRPGGMRAIIDAAWRTGISCRVGGMLNSDLSFRGFTEDRRLSDYPDGCCVAFRRDVWEDVGEYDEVYSPAYCLTPDTPVLTSDLKWVPIGSVSVGDCLVGIDEFASNNEDRKYRPSVVTSASRRVAECVRITFSDGRIVECTTDHKWLCKLPEPSGDPYKWRKTERIAPGYRVSAPLCVWNDDRSYEAGWLAGILDGEGYIRKNKNGRTFGIGIAQNPGAVLDRAKRILYDNGIPFTFRKHGEDSDVVNIEINARRYVFQVLGQFRPVRLMLDAENAWHGRSTRSRMYPVGLEVTSVEAIGPREVVTIETTTKTYIANGLVSHNCEDSDWGLRARSKGYVWEIVPESIVHLGQKTSKEMDGIHEAHERNVGVLRERYSGMGLGERILIRRWGAIGDIVMATAPIAELRRKKPLAHIELTCHPAFAGLFSDIPQLDFCGSESGEYSEVFNLDGDYERLQAESRWLHPARVYGKRIGVEVGPEQYHVTEALELREWAAETIPDGTVALGVRSAYRPKANWREGKWADLVKRNPQTRYALFDVDPNACLAPFPEERGALRSCPNVLDLRGQIPDTRHLIAALRRCQACVTVDTGILHLAAACGLPVVALMGGVPGNARAPLASPAAWVDGRASCFPCQSPSRCARQEERNEEHCLAHATPQMVEEALAAALAKHPPSFYGVEYLKRPLAGGGGATRWEDNGLFFGSARFAQRIFPERARLLHVGCGRGFVVNHLRALGYRADGVEYGAEAVEHSVCGAVWGDLCGQLPKQDGAYDGAFALGVMSHFPALYADNALSELACVLVVGGMLWTGIQIAHDYQSGHHRNVHPREWWEPRFRAAGFEPADLGELLEKFGFNRNPATWNCVWRKNV